MSVERCSKRWRALQRESRRSILKGQPPQSSLHFNACPTGPLGEPIAGFRTTGAPMHLSVWIPLRRIRVEHWRHSIRMNLDMATAGPSPPGYAAVPETLPRCLPSGPLKLKHTFQIETDAHGKCLVAANGEAPENDGRCSAGSVPKIRARRQPFQEPSSHQHFNCTLTYCLVESQ